MSPIKLKLLWSSVVTGISVISFGLHSEISYSYPELQLETGEKQISSEEIEDTSTDIAPVLPLSTSEWQAYENRQPIGFPTLYVEGDVRLPNPGYDAELIRPVEQDYRDETLTLVLQIVEPSGNFIYPAVVTTEPVRYEDEFYIGDYNQVIIRGANGSVLETIDIRTVR